MNDDQGLMQFECYNLFTQKRDTILTWNEVLSETARLYGRNRDQVFETMNRLIDDGKIEVNATDNTGNYSYSLPGIFSKQCKQQAYDNAKAKANSDAKTLSRKEYDLLHPYQQADFCRNGGRITA